MGFLFRAVVRAVVAVAVAGVTPATLAQQWPAKPVRWIMPFPPGGPADVIARAISPKLGERLGQPVIIENKAGGQSNIGHDAAAKADPDGHTILYVVPNVVTNPSLFKGMVDPFTQLAPVTQLTSQSYILVANPGFAPQTIADIIAAAKANPGGVTCASGGGLMTFGCEWLRTITKTDITHVQYKGNAPALRDLLGGQVNLLFNLFNTSDGLGGLQL